MSGIIGLKKWETAALENVCEIVSGSTPKTGVAEYWDGDIPWATPKDLSKLDSISIDSTEKRITERGLKSCSSRMLPAGSVLFSSRAPIGHVAINSVPMCTNQGFKSLIPVPSKLHNKFLYFWLRANREYLDGLGNGATFKEVSKKIVGSVEIPLPSLAEQKRLAAILDRADAVRRARRKSLARMDEMAQSLFLELFGDPATNPKGWDIVPLESQIDFLTSGSRGWAQYYSDEGDLFLRIQNIGKNGLMLDDIAYVTAPQSAEAKRTKVQPGDLLLSITADLGRTGVIPPNFPTAYINQHLAIIRLNKDIDPFFVAELMTTPHGAAQFRKLDKSAVKSGLNFNDVRSFTVMMPPLRLQRQFAAQIEELETIKSRARASLTELDALFASLQHRAFSGDLSSAHSDERQDSMHKNRQKRAYFEKKSRNKQRNRQFCVRMHSHAHPVHRRKLQVVQ